MHPTDTTFIPPTRSPKSNPTAEVIVVAAAVIALTMVAGATPASAKAAGDRNGQSATATPQNTTSEKQKPADPAKAGEPGKGRAGGTEDPAQDPSQPPPATQPPATQPPATAPVSTPPTPPQDEDDDMSIDPLQPDFTIVALPTTLRMPKYKGAFRVTHRFSRGLGTGDFGDLLENFFGFDSPTGIALEFRFGLAPGLQGSVHRTNGKVIQLLLQYNVMKQDAGRPLGLDVLVAAEGKKNFSEDFSEVFGFVLSRKVGSVGSIYLEPIFVANAPRARVGEPPSDDHSLLVGIGLRLRVRPTVALVAEVIPRVAGYSPRDHQWAVGLEKRVGGHSFQINVGNSFWTTFGTIATGGLTRNREDLDNWLIGFNITRKFF